MLLFTVYLHYLLSPDCGIGRFVGIVSIFLIRRFVSITLNRLVGGSWLGWFLKRFNVILRLCWLEPGGQTLHTNQIKQAINDDLLDARATPSVLCNNQEVLEGTQPCLWNYLYLVHPFIV